MRNSMKAIVLTNLLLLGGCSRSEHTLYPLAEGLTWTYQRAGNPEILQATVTVTNLAQRDLGGQKVSPQRLDVGDLSEFVFVVGDQTGIYEYARQVAGAIEPEILRTPRYFIKYPLEIGASWDSTLDSFLVEEGIQIPTVTTIESLDETVTVPIGTFEHCAKLKTVGELTHDSGSFIFGKINLSRAEHSWFCDGVGMVKFITQESETYGNKFGYSMELAGRSK